jgi:glycosyltransferase involved in cell wall biosynthesis
MPLRRVLVDGFFLGKPYGFGRFADELCRALGSTSSEIEIIVAVPARIDVRSLPTYRNLRWQPMRNANFMIWEQLLIPRLAHCLGCEVIHFPYNTRAVWSRGLRVVTTVHDVIFLAESVPLSRPKNWFVQQYAKYVFKAATGRSDALVSVSETTRRTLESLGLQAITVYNTVDGFRAILPEMYTSVAKPYFLHRGGYSPHRNTQRVIRAFLKARQWLPDISLKIIGVPDGADRWGTQGEPSIEYLPWLSDKELAERYVGCACVIAASLQEGFGLPVIEGFAFGAPVITSDVDPMREVAGGAAILVDPHNAEALQEAMVSIATNDTLARSLVERGYARLATFSGPRVAERMIEIYRSCLDHPAPGEGARLRKQPGG